MEGGAQPARPWRRPRPRRRHRHRRHRRLTPRATTLGHPRSQEKRALITAYAGEIEALRARLAAQVAKDGVHLSEAEYEGLTARVRELEVEVEELGAVIRAAGITIE